MPAPERNSSKGQLRTETDSETSIIKDTQKNILLGILDNRTLRTNPFGDNISADSVYQRTERVASAIHLVTAHISDDEPLRRSVRNESIQLPRYALLLRSELRAAASQKIRLLQESIRLLITYVRLLGISGYISTQNVQIIVESLDELNTLLITSQRSTLAEDVALTIEDMVPRRVRMPMKTASATRAVRGRGSPGKVGGAGADIKDGRVKGTGEESVSSPLRAERILDILRSGGLLGIKDISANLPQYSEKMIQRELADLVDQKQVKKSGEKRWSKYSLVQ